VPEFDVVFDPQYVRRQFEKAVGRSVVKVLTEPLTNSDDSFQRLAARGLGPATGRIVIELDRTKRTFALIDQAEGITDSQMHERFVTYGKQSSDRSAGIKTRSLFGKGLRDVLFTQEESLVRSIRDGKAYVCKFRLRSSSGESKPVIDIGEGPRVTDALRKAWGIEGNGTRVQFRLHEAMSLPQTDRLQADLERFYMLRPLLSRDDRSVVLRIVGRSGVDERPIRHVPPAAAATTELDRAEWETEWDGHLVQATAVLNAFEDDLVQGEKGLEEREGGLLVLDEDGAALDLTLFGYDKDPGAARFFGVLRLDGAGALIRDRLAAERPEEILTETRDGFNTSHPFYRAIQDRVYKWLTPHVERERSRRAGEPTKLSGATQKRHAEAFEQLNKLYRRLLGETAGLGTGAEPKPVSTDKPLEFRWPSLMIQVGSTGTAQLLVNTSRVAPGSVIAVNVDSADVARPMANELVVPDPGEDRTTVVVAVRLEGIRVGDAVVEARCAGASADIACSVLPEIVPDLTDGMAFVPDMLTVADGERITLSLFADLRLAPDVDKVQIVSDNAHVEVLDAEPSWQALTAYVVRAAVRVHGSGIGEEAIFTASADGIKAEAYVKVVSKKTRPRAGGHFRGYEFQARDRMLPAEIDSRGIVIVNLTEPTNRLYFGDDAAGAVKAVEKNASSATLLAELILNVCLQAAVSEAYQKGKLKVRFPRDPATDIAVHIAEQRYEIGSVVHRLFVPQLAARA